MKTQKQPQAQLTRTVLVYRALSFLKPEITDQANALAVDIENGKKRSDVNQSAGLTADPSVWCHLQPSRNPQPIPEWVVETDGYKAAIAANYITEIMVAGPLKVPESIKPNKDTQVPGNMQEEYFPPLAAETRPNWQGARSGLGRA